MCGLSGIFNLDQAPAESEDLSRMVAALAHRGPDGAGFYFDGNLALGHRRLAVIDLDRRADQPLGTEDGDLTIVFNGEVYNHPQLRKELESEGFSFRTRSDAEVVLKAYARWGEECLRRFNGMFALAIWDRRRRELVLARDRYGIKPLYFCRQGSSFLFASEQKALLAHRGFQRRRIDFEALLEYFTFQNFFNGRTLLEGVSLFPAGHLARLSVDRDNGEPRLRQFWDYHFAEPERPARDEEYLEELDRLFSQAVRRQLISDVEVGAYLSGGLDSGAIAQAAAEKRPFMKTFTCGFDLSSANGLELGCDERVKAERMSYLFKTEHYEMVLKSGDMERVMPRLAAHIEEPRVGQSYPNFYAAQLASRFVKVVLSGAGGDELFGGYPWRYFRAVRNHDFEDYIDKYYLFWQRLIPGQMTEALFRPIWPQIRHVRTREIFRNVFPASQASPQSVEDYINASLYFEAKTFLHGLLVVEDKLSMAHGLETRLPFLDNDLVDFAQSIPVRLKLRNFAETVRINENEAGSKSDSYFNKTKDGKLILRDMMARRTPPEISQSPKQGFSAPDASWFRGDSIDYIKRFLADRRAAIYDFFDRPTVLSLLDDHFSARQNRRLFIWSLLSFEHWLKIYR